jgi:hypothetical protein
MSQSALWQGVAPPPDDWTRCDRDEDCAPVEVGCCDHCNGGKLLVVNARNTKEALGRYATKSCTSGCTEVACGPTRVLCEQNRCTRANAHPECS